MNYFSTVCYQKEDGIAYIWLNRPEVLNAYNLAMRDELYQVMKAIREDDEVCIAVLQALGRDFCAGADLSEFGTAPSQVVARQVRWERDVWGSFLGIEKPLICGIHGYCVGSGAEMALLCDIRLASSDAVFAMPEVGLGMIPAAGGTETIPRYLGVGRAMDILLTRRRIGALEALDMGLVNRVVPRGTLASEVECIARQLASLNWPALRAAKRVIWHGMDLPLHSALELEVRLSSQVMDQTP